MEKINKGIVFSDDIKKILNGINAFDYKYEFVPSDSTIKYVRERFKNDTNRIFNGNVTIISEDEMMGVKKLLDGDYPHCVTRQNLY